MKKIALILYMLPAYFISYGQSQSCISQKEAEEILGRPAHLSMQKTETIDNIVKYRCTYSMIRTGDAESRESNLYYLFEEYDKAATAEKSFARIISQNEGMPGLYRLPGFGDEAIIQTDSLNFQLIIVRKSDKIIRIKVNKVTATTSMKEMKTITKKITDSL